MSKVRTTNPGRLAAAQAAVNAYAREKDVIGQSLKHTVADLLTDLKYRVAAENISFDACLRFAGFHYELESPNAYAGWTNYQTWAVHLWLTNDESSHKHCREEAEAHVRNAPHADAVRRGIFSESLAARFGLANQLCQEFKDAVPIQEASVYSDLLESAMDEVNWADIAQAFINAVSS